jgi:hypothetical protein
MTDNTRLSWRQIIAEAEAVGRKYQALSAEERTALRATLEATLDALDLSTNAARALGYTLGRLDAIDASEAGA